MPPRQGGWDTGELCYQMTGTPGSPPPAPSINGLILERLFTFTELLFPHWDKIKIDDVDRKHFGNDMLMLFMVCWLA